MPRCALHNPQPTKNTTVSEFIEPVYPDSDLSAMVTSLYNPLLTDRGKLPVR